MRSLFIVFAMIFSTNLMGACEMSEESTPNYLYKVLSKEAWEKSATSDKLYLSEMDDAFIHLATEEQLSHVLKKFWSNKEYVTLKIETKKLVGNLRYECNPGRSTKYYHLYEGCIPLDSIKEVVTLG